MDRLPHLIGLCLLAGACAGEPAAPAGPAPSRVDAVAAAPAPVVDLGAFCEARPAAGAAPALTWPALHASTPTAPATGRWTWVNVWATWCGPCIEEMPRLMQWPERLGREGAPVDLVFLSTDTDASAVDRFRQKNAWAPDSLLMADGATAPAWVESLGLGLPTVLPLHLFVDPSGRVVCARSGSIQSDAYPAVKAVVRGG